MATNQPAEPSGYDPSKIASVRAADIRNDQSVRDWLHQTGQSGLDWLHQFSQTLPESPDTVKARQLAQKAFATDAALVNADIRTKEQNNAISHQIYGDQSAPASTAVDTAKNIILERAMSPANGQSATANPPVTDTSPTGLALAVANQASPLPLFAQPHSGAQYQPMSASSRSWTDMPPPSNYMPWGDSAPAAAAPAGPIHTAPARATAPAAAASTAPAAAAPIAPAQSSPGFFSGLFKDPYAGMSPKEMNVEAQKMLLAGDEYGANVLTQRADNAMTSPDGSFAQGGSVDENHPVVQRAMHLVRSFLLNG